jgi:hypothetical protein
MLNFRNGSASGQKDTSVVPLSTPESRQLRIDLNTDRRALACAAVEQLSPELILLWWVNRELDGAMIDLGAAISAGMKRT